MKLYYSEPKRTKIYQGDNAELFSALPDKSIKLMFADPPYGLDKPYKSPFKDTWEYYEMMTDRLLTEGLRVSETLIVTPGGYTNVDYWKKECDKRGIEWFRFCWYKGAMPYRSPVGFAHWEEVLIFGKMYASIPDFVYAAPENDKQGHECPKPTALLSFFINGYTKPNDIVCDPFLGAGTTLVVAKALNRKGIGTELSEHYCEISAKRLAEQITFEEKKPAEQIKMDL